MTFRFEYRYYRKYIKEKEAGFSIIVDDEFETIELLTLNNMNNIINTTFINISSLSKEKIKTILKKNSRLFELNSYMYLDGDKKDLEQMFYFEINQKNRKVEGFNINSNNIENVDVKLLENVFNEISLILLSDGIKLSLDDISIIK